MRRQRKRIRAPGATQERGGESKTGGRTAGGGPVWRQRPRAPGAAQERGGESKTGG